MSTHQVVVLTHAVETFKITGVGPLGIQGRMVGPNEGLMLTLADGTRHRWLAETGSITPTVDDFLIRDTELNQTYVVPQEKFYELFEVFEEKSHV